MAQVKNITPEEEKKVPRALFGDVMGITKKLVNCEGCGVMLHRSNLARPREWCGHCLKKSTTGGIQMKFKLPGVMKALKRKVPQDEECQSPDLCHLPLTPETDDKLCAKKVTKPRSSSLTYKETRLSLRIQMNLKDLRKHLELGDGICIPLRSGPEKSGKWRVVEEEMPLQELPRRTFSH